MRIVLVSTYELGHQPFGLASPKAWLTRAGHEVTSVDVAKTPLSEDLIRQAGAVAFSLPMHTATRLAVKVIEKVRTLNPRAHLCCYGLYAPMNEAYLRELGVEAVLGGEFEQGLRDLAQRLAARRDGPRELALIAALFQLARPGNPFDLTGEVIDKPEVIAEVSAGLGKAMPGLDVASMPAGELLATRGW